MLKHCALCGCRDACANGMLFPDQGVDPFVKVVEWLHQEWFWCSPQPEVICAWAEHFKLEAFAARFESALRKAWSSHQRGCAVAASDPADMPEPRL